MQDPIKETLEIADKYHEFFEAWHFVMLVIGLAAIALTTLTYILHAVRLYAQSTLKDRYDFVSIKQPRYLKAAFLYLSFVVFAFVNSLNRWDLKQTLVHLGILGAASIVAAFAFGYCGFLFVEVYYPKIQAARLRRLRNVPRINPKTGNTMKLLSEQEEDEYLDEGMQAEENILSVDYDVWLDEQTGDTIIEKYAGNLIAQKCDKCQFQTLRLVTDALVQGEAVEELRGSGEVDPTTMPAKGDVILQEYKCSYCKREFKKAISVKKKDNKASLSTTMQPADIQTIHIQVTQADGKEQFFDFKSVKEAQSFLSKCETNAPETVADQAHNSTSAES